MSYPSQFVMNTVPDPGSAGGDRPRHVATAVVQPAGGQSPPWEGTHAGSAHARPPSAPHVFAAASSGTSAGCGSASFESASKTATARCSLAGRSEPEALHALPTKTKI